MLENHDTLILAVAAGGVGFIFNQVIGGLIKARFAKQGELETEVFKGLLRSQEELAVRLREDRERSGKHFEELWGRVKCIGDRLIVLETHHVHNHPSQPHLPPSAPQRTLKK